MKKYIVTYDLNKSDKNYSGLISAIENYNNIKILYSAYVIKTNESANSIYNNLKPHIDNNDNIIVIEINPSNEQGWLSKDKWDWINN